MSLVVAIRDGNRFILGADKQASSWNNKVHTATKIWETEYENCCIGSVGTARGSQVIQYIKGLLDNAGFGKAELDDAFIHLQLPRTLYETLKAHGVLVEDSTREFFLPNAFFIAYKDRCWKINQDLSVEEVEDYDAIGSGEDVAQGVIETALAYGEKNPYMVISHAIDIAAEKTLYVDHEIDFVETGHTKKDTINKLDALGIEVPVEVRKSKNPAEALLQLMLNPKQEAEVKEIAKEDAKANKEETNEDKPTKKKSAKKQRLLEDKE